MKEGDDMKIKAIVFDLYNTLIQMNDISRKPYFLMFKNSGLSNENLKEIILTKDYPDLKTFCEKYTVEKSKQYEKLDDEIGKALETARFFPETEEVLKKLKQEGYLIGVISNLSSAYKKPFFTLGIDKMIDHYIFSCETGFKKPDERIFKHMTSIFNIRGGEALMIGDSLVSDYQGAKNAGLNALLLDRENKSDQKEKIGNLQEISTFLKVLQKTF